MEKPIYHDVEKFERECREMLAQMRTTGAAAVEAGHASKSFFDAQCQYEEARVQYAIAALKCTNLGCSEEDIAAAAGAAMGIMYATHLYSYRQQPVLAGIFDGWIARASFDSQNGVTEDGIEVEIVASEPIVGGNA